MARRRRSESILDILIELPWWVSVLFAGLLYAVLKYGLPAYPIPNPYLAMPAKGIEPLAGGIGAFCLHPAPL